MTTQPTAPDLDEQIAYMRGLIGDDWSVLSQPPLERLAAILASLTRLAEIDKAEMPEGAKLHWLIERNSMWGREWFAAKEDDNSRWTQTAADAILFPSRHSAIEAFCGFRRSTTPLTFPFTEDGASGDWEYHYDITEHMFGCGTQPNAPAERPEPVAWIQSVQNPGEPERMLLSVACQNDLHRQIKQGGTYQRKPLYSPEVLDAYDRMQAELAAANHDLTTLHDGLNCEVKARLEAEAERDSWESRAGQYMDERDKWKKDYLDESGDTAELTARLKFEVDRAERLQRERDALEVRLRTKQRTLERIVNEQAEDAGLWLAGPTIAEDMLQRALRRLHDAVEGRE